MKQKIVMKLPTDDAKSRTKAMKIAVALPGVISASSEGVEIVIVGDDVDSVQLTTRLRKKMGFTELVSVSKVEEKKEEKEKPSSETVELPAPLAYLDAKPHYIYQYVPEPTHDTCTIM